MKRREGGRRDSGDRVYPQPLSVNDAFRAAHFGGVRISEPPPDKRTRKIHHLVAVSVPADRCGDWLGDVSLLEVMRKQIAGIEPSFCRSMGRNLTSHNHPAPNAVRCLPAL